MDSCYFRCHVSGQHPDSRPFCHRSVGHPLNDGIGHRCEECDNLTFSRPEKLRSHQHNIKPAEWMADCDFRYNICQHETDGPRSRYILGMDEDGDLFVPLDWGHPDSVYRPFNRWIPLHWLAYFTSWKRREIADLESHP